MFNSLYRLRMHAKIVSISAILLMLWLNIAFVEHQLDASPSHHSHHHCQLFASANHALTHHIPEIPVWISYHYIEPVTQALSITITHFAYLARSPPTP